MGSLANYAENKALDHVFGGPDFTRPATLYLGLSTTLINDDGTGITEPVGGGYARLAITNNATNFPAAVNGAKSNGVEFRFAVANGDWGLCTHWFFSDGDPGGNIIGHGELSVHKLVRAGDTPRFAVGELDLACD